MKNKKYEIKYKGQTIPYECIRKNIKNMYIYIKDGKVTVKVPIRLKEKAIHEFVTKKAKWIYENVHKEKNKIKKEETIEPQELEKLKEMVITNVHKYESLLKVKPNQVRIKNIKYAWGSCSSKKNISINVKLAKKPKEAIEYVVLHEMCHLRYMNHSKKFWDLVEKYMPEYKEYKKILK